MDKCLTYSCRRPPVASNWNQARSCPRAWLSHLASVVVLEAHLRFLLHEMMWPIASPEWISLALWTTYVYILYTHTDLVSDHLASLRTSLTQYMRLPSCRSLQAQLDRVRARSTTA